MRGEQTLAKTVNISRSKEYHWLARTPSEESSHMAFSYHVEILTSCVHFHLAWTFSPHMVIFTLHGHFHIACMQDYFLRYDGVSPAPSEMSPHMGIFTFHGHSHLTWAFSPHIDILTSHGHSHLMYILTCSPPHGNNIFHLTWKNSQKIHESTPMYNPFLHFLQSLVAFALFHISI